MELLDARFVELEASGEPGAGAEPAAGAQGLASAPSVDAADTPDEVSWFAPGTEPAGTDVAGTAPGGATPGSSVALGTDQDAGSTKSPCSNASVVLPTPPTTPRAAPPAALVPPLASCPAEEPKPPVSATKTPRPATPRNIEPAAPRDVLDDQPAAGSPSPPATIGVRLTEAEDAPLRGAALPTRATETATDTATAPRVVNWPPRGPGQPVH